MAFVRTKTVKGRPYHYLSENRWEDGKVRQRTVAYLGRYKTVAGAFHHWQARADNAETAADRSHAKQMIRKLQPYL